MTEASAVSSSNWGRTDDSEERQFRFKNDAEFAGSPHTARQNRFHQISRKVLGGSTVGTCGNLTGSSRPTSLTKGPPARAAQFTTDETVSGRFGLLVHDSFRDLRQRSIGLFFFLQRLVKQTHCVIQAKFLRPCF